MRLVLCACGLLACCARRVRDQVKDVSSDIALNDTSALEPLLLAIGRMHPSRQIARIRGARMITDAEKAAKERWLARQDGSSVGRVTTTMPDADPDVNPFLANPSPSSRQRMATTMPMGSPAMPMGASPAMPMRPSPMGSPMGPSPAMPMRPSPMGSPMGPSPAMPMRPSPMGSPMGPSPSMPMGPSPAMPMRPSPMPMGSAPGRSRQDGFGAMTTTPAPFGGRRGQAFDSSNSRTDPNQNPFVMRNTPQPSAQAQQAPSQNQRRQGEQGRDSSWAGNQGARSQGLPPRRGKDAAFEIKQHDLQVMDAGGSGRSRNQPLPPGSREPRDVGSVQRTARNYPADRLGYNRYGSDIDSNQAVSHQNTGISGERFEEARYGKEADSNQAVRYDNQRRPNSFDAARSRDPLPGRAVPAMPMGPSPAMPMRSSPMGPSPAMPMRPSPMGPPATAERDMRFPAPGSETRNMRQYDVDSDYDNGDYYGQDRGMDYYEGPPRQPLDRDRQDNFAMVRRGQGPRGNRMDDRRQLGMRGDMQYYEPEDPMLYDGNVELTNVLFDQLWDRIDFAVTRKIYDILGNIFR